MVFQDNNNKKQMSLFFPMSPNLNLTDLFTSSSLEPKFTSRARVPDVRDFVDMKLPNVNPQAASIGERF
jgi:hypothetical protein